jgi:hypothetical protein
VFLLPETSFQPCARYHTIFDSHCEPLDLCPMCGKRLNKTFTAQISPPGTKSTRGIQIRFQQT